MKEFRSEYKLLSSKVLLSDTSYQRPLDFARVKKIVSNFDPNRVEPIKVSRRENGGYYVFDGQHTLRALILKNDNKDLQVFCKVYYGMTYEDEALMFAMQSDLTQAVTSNQKLLSLYRAKDPDVLEMKKAVEDAGLKCTFTGAGKTDWSICCYTHVYRIYAKHGPAYTTDLMKLLVEIWNGNAESLRKEIIMAMSIFLDMYDKDDRYNRGRLVRALQKVPPRNILAKGKEFSLKSDRKYAKAILIEYNRGLRNKLPDRFD